MRALFYPFQNAHIGETILIEGDSAHHLNVVRAKVGDELLLLNGKGNRMISKIQTMDKKNVGILVEEVTSDERKTKITLALANPKKDAFEDILKIAVELGVDVIQPLSSQFSQYDYVESERTGRLLESALIQSNNSFLPTINAQQPLKNYLQTLSSPLYFFNSRPVTSSKDNSVPDSFHLLIGPEGGFSLEEIQFISDYKDSVQVHLPTPILRAPTAVSAAIGFILALKFSK
jgi:16S rRNA (uracil1498-N3)-methyltransferase